MNTLTHVPKRTLGMDYDDQSSCWQWSERPSHRGAIPIGYSAESAKRVANNNTPSPEKNRPAPSYTHTHSHGAQQGWSPISRMIRMRRPPVRKKESNKSICGHNPNRHHTLPLVLSPLREKVSQRRSKNVLALTGHTRAACTLPPRRKNRSNTQNNNTPKKNLFLTNTCTRSDQTAPSPSDTLGLGGPNQGR